MLDISQFQLFVASFMWTKSLLCSFCKCLNCRVDLNSNNVNNKATDFLPSWTYHFDLFWNSYQYLIILLHAATAASSVWSEVLWCCAADRLCACAAVLQAEELLTREPAVRVWLHVCSVCILHSCCRQLYSLLSSKYALIQPIFIMHALKQLPYTWTIKYSSLSDS